MPFGAWNRCVTGRRLVEGPCHDEVLMATDDQVLQAELLKLNAFLALEAEREQKAKAERRAAKKREEAAAELKRLNADPKASKEEKDAAEAAWKAALGTEPEAQAEAQAEPAAEPEPGPDAAPEAQPEAPVSP